MHPVSSAIGVQFRSLSESDSKADGATRLFLFERGFEVIGAGITEQAKRSKLVDVEERDCCGGRTGDRRGGKPHCGGGGCDSKSSCLSLFILAHRSPCLSQFTSAHILSVNIGDVGGRRGSKSTSISVCSESPTEHTCPTALH